jgi:IclR family acetate operon transcriptional repressor
MTDMRVSDPTGGVSIIERMTAVLGTFSANHDRGLPKSTTSRLVAGLVRHGYLQRDGQEVSVGLRLFELGTLSAQPNALRSLAMPTMSELRKATMQTVHLSILEGTDVLYIGILRGRESSALLSRVGGRLPAHATGAGKALLAFAPPEVVRRVIETATVSARHHHRPVSAAARARGDPAHTRRLFHRRGRARRHGRREPHPHPRLVPGGGALGLGAHRRFRCRPHRAGRAHGRSAGVATERVVGACPRRLRARQPPSTEWNTPSACGSATGRLGSRPSP